MPPLSWKNYVCKTTVDPLNSFVLVKNKKCKDRKSTNKKHLLIKSNAVFRKLRILYNALIAK